MQTRIDRCQGVSRALMAGLAAIAVLSTGSVAAEAATLTADPNPVAFGKVQAGTSQTITLTEGEGDATLTLTIGVDDMVNFALTGVPLGVAASGTATFDVVCVTAGNHTGEISVTWTGAMGNGSFTIPVSCDAPAMWIDTTADPFDFAGQEVGTTSTSESFVITNDSGGAAEITNVTTAGTDCAEFPIATDTLPIALADGASTTIMVQFAPSFRGGHACTLTVVDDVAGIADNTLGLTGTGEGAAIELTPSGTIDFGNQRVGTTSATMNLTIANIGDPGYALDVTSIGKSGTSAAEFTLGGFTSGSIAQGTSQVATITFTPSATGTRNATLTVNTSEPSSITAAKSVTGTGVQRLLVPDPTTVNIGNVRINGTTFADGTLQMTNPGAATVQVSTLALTGGQAADFSLVSPPMLPHDIAGGAQSPLTVRCNPAAIGTRTTTLRISSNDDGPNPDDVTVNCTGVRSYVSMSSVADIDFGDVLVGTTGNSPLTVSNLNNANVVSLNGTIAASPSTFGSTVTTISNLAGGGSIPFNVQFSPTTDGVVTGTLTVATDDPVTPTITINLTGRGVRPDITLVAPAGGTLNFGNVQVGTTSGAQTVTVRNDGTSDLTISGVTRTGGTPGQFSHTNPGPLPIVLAPSASGNFSVTCSPTSVGAKSTTLRFTHDDIWGSENPLDVALTCNGVQAALTITPTPISYGDVRVCENSDINVTLRNSGTASLTVNNIMTSGSQFAIVSGPPMVPPFTLAPSATSTFTLRFEPTVGGNATGSLTVQSTDPNSPAVVAISGNGVLAQMGISANSHAFGDVRIDQAFPQQTFTITNTGTANFSLMSLGSTNNTDFLVQSISPATLPATLTPTQTATFSVQARPQTLGAKTATITANTDIPNAPCGMAATTVAVTADGVVPDIGLAPNTIGFGPHDLQAAPAVQSITISNTGTAPLEVSDLQISGTDAARFAVSSNALPFTIPVSNSSVVQVTYTPSVVSTGDSAVLRVTTDAQSGVNMDIPLAGRGIDRVILVSTTQLDFPQTYRNTETPSQLSFDVQNTGEAPLAITMVTKTGGGENAFQLVDMIPASIGGGANETVVVEFAPTSSGDFSAVLVLTNDDDQQPMVEIDLTGQGRVPNFAPAVGEYPIGRIGVGIPTRLTSAIPDGIRFVNMEPQAFTVRELRLVDQDGVALDPSLARVVDFQAVPVGAAETYMVDVELTAEEPGIYDVTLEVFLDADPDRVSFVTIRAEAVEVRLRGGGCDGGGGGGGAGVVLLVLAVLLGLGARRRRVLAPLGALVLVALMTPGTVARADRTRNLDLGTFQPMPSVEADMLSVETPSVGESGAWSLGVFVNHAVNPLNLESPQVAGQSDALVGGRTAFDVAFSYAFANRFEAGLLMPLLQQSGSETMVVTGVEPAQGFALGDLALHGKMSLLAAGPLELGVSTTVTVPTSTSGEFAGVSGATAQARGLLAASFGRAKIAANGGFLARGTGQFGDLEQGNELTYGLAANYRVQRQLWAVGEIFGAFGLSNAGSTQGVSPLETAVGARYRLTRELGIVGGFGRGILPGIGAPTFRAIVSVAYTPNATEIGVLSVGGPGPVAEDTGDDDVDGIINAKDECPNEPEDKDGFQDEDGCPDLDNDADGLADAADPCPNEAEDKDGFKDEDGCPDLDNDEDKIPDTEDKCPDEPEDMDSFQDRDGCDDPDNDGDGIPDVIDQCALQAESINGVDDDDGCPDEGESLVMVMPDRIEVFEPVKFSKHTDKILKSSHNMLGQVAATLRANRDFLRVRIAVHVHPRNNQDLQLSQLRAQAVRKWLVQWGIEPERLEIKGFGSARPLVPASKRGASAVNDRIEFIVLEKRVVN